MPASPVAILVSDIHLSDKPPTFRSAEPDWYKAMARPLRQLRYLSWKYDVPIICGGDVFDKWNSSPQLINFAIDNLPKMYSIAGQHDLPHHQYQSIEKSAYWTLCKTGNIIDIKENEPIEIDGLMIHGFGWNVDIQPCTLSDLCLHIAVVHKYIWSSEETSYFGAPKLNHIKEISKKLKGYDAALFGDNHKGFLSNTNDGIPILNNGGFMRRTKDQMDYEPSIGILYDDGKIKRKKLDCSKDKTILTDNNETIKTEIDFQQFMDELNHLGSDSLDFQNSIRRYCENKEVRDEVYLLITELL